MEAHASRMDNNLALVLGGGGATGNAWEIGVLAGFDHAGIRVANDAGVIIGTSAGATTAAQISGNVSLSDLYEQAVAPAPTSTGRSQQRSAPAIPVSTVFDRMRQISANAHSAQDIRAGMGAFALECDPVLDADADAWRATVESRFPARSWPEQRLLITAVNAHTGELVAFDRSSGVDIVDAVTASCSLPGGVASREINGERFIDGGAHSAENVHLASGYRHVVVLAPLARRPGSEGHATMFEGLRREPSWGTELFSCIEDLEAGGSSVLLLTPSPAVLEAMGGNNMNPAARAATAQAGFRQGVESARSLGQFLES